MNEVVLNVAAGTRAAKTPAAGDKAGGDAFSGILDRKPREAGKGHAEAGNGGRQVALEGERPGREERSREEADADTALRQRSAKPGLAGMMALRIPFGTLAGASPVAAQATKETEEKAGKEDLEGGIEDAKPDEEAAAEGMSVQLATLLRIPAERPTGGNVAEALDDLKRRTSGTEAAPAAAADETESGEAETVLRTAASGEVGGGEARQGEDRSGGDGGFRRAGGLEPLPLRAAVTAEANNIATPVPQNAQTVAGLAAAIASDGDWQALVQDLKAVKSEAQTTPPGPVRDLRIQLNPGSLGEINARLRISGELLAVEIRVEGGEAFHRLSADRDAVLTSLRGLGFQVDDVTVILQQPGPATAPGASARDGMGGSSLSQGSDQQRNGQAGAGREGRESNSGRQNADAQAHRAGPDAGGVFI